MQLTKSTTSLNRLFRTTTLVIFCIGAGQVAADSTYYAREASLLTQMANNGNSGAQLQLGLAYEHGRFGLKPDSRAAWRWLQRAAQGGNAYAADLVANHMAEQPHGDLQQAAGWWKQAAVSGNADAERHLGEYLVEHDAEAAVGWLRKAADLGDHLAEQDLLKLYPMTDLNEADLHRDENTMAVVGNRIDSTTERVLSDAWDILKLSSTYEQSAEPLIKRAKQGDPIAEYELALRYRDGAWAVNRNPQKALFWLQRAAAAGNHLAEQELERIKPQARQAHGVDIHDAQINNHS